MSPSSADGAYSPAFLEHLTHPRSQGRLEAATHRGEAVDGVCGDRLSLDLEVVGGAVREVRFRVEGCPGAIAVGSALATLAVGRAASPVAVTAADVEAALGGVPGAKRHALRLAIETWKAALAAPVG